MVIACFKITNSIDYTRRFEKTYFIADIPQQIVLDMLFLKLKDPNIS